MRLCSVAAVRTLAPAAEGLGVQVRPQPARWLAGTVTPAESRMLSITSTGR